LQPYNARRRKSTSEDKKIVSMVKGRKQKVKPNYKKKQAEAINKYYRKKKRTLIQTKIKEQQKERAKAKAKGENE